MLQRTATAEKILARTKGLSAHLEEGEEPVLALPAIWDNGESSHSTACDVIVTNRRVIGFYYKSFPKERVFIESLRLAELSNVTWREKSYEPVFREILISDGKRKVYLRTPRQKSEELYAALRTESTASTPIKNESRDQQTIEDERQGAAGGASQANTQTAGKTIYGRQDVKRAFDTSTLAVLLLFVGGIILEIIGVVLWMATGSAQTGIPLFVAGFLAVFAAILVRRQQRM